MLVSAPSDDETQLSFSTLSDLLGGVMDEVGEDLPDPQRRALAVALLLASPDDYGPDQRTVAAATLSVLRTLAERGPVVIALDDVQSTDEPSAEALAFGVRRLGNAPVAVLTTLHGPGTSSTTVVTALERRLDHRLERRRVGPLTPTGSARAPPGSTRDGLSAHRPRGRLRPSRPPEVTPSTRSS